MNREETLKKIEELEKEIEKLKANLRFPELKSGYRVTLRNGKVMILIDVDTSYHTGLVLVDPNKDSFTWHSIDTYKLNKNNIHTSYDIVKVEKLYHPYSVFYTHNYPCCDHDSVVLWEE